MTSAVSDLATPRNSALPRDTDPTAFTTILESLVRRVPGAYAAALVDSLGETVDYAGDRDPFELRVAAAHLQIVVAGIERLGALGAPSWLVVRGDQKSIAASVLPDGYVLALLLQPRAAFALSTRALDVCTRALAVEAGLGSVEQRAHAKAGSWFDVSVVTDHRGRPTHVGAGAMAVEVLGAVMGLSVRERGFRVRTADGSEITLVREPEQLWYADVPV